MKPFILTMLLCAVLLLPACEGKEKIQKDEVLVDTLKVAQKIDESMLVEQGIIEFDIPEMETILAQAEKAFQFYFDLPIENKDGVISVLFSAKELIQAELERAGTDVIDQIQIQYPQRSKLGYYMVSKKVSKDGASMTGKFEEETNEVLEISNPFLENTQLGQKLTVQEAETVARNFVAEKDLVGVSDAFDLVDQYRFSLPDQNEDFLWFRYENQKEPDNQVLVFMRTDSLSILGFSRGYRALLMQNEIEKYAEWFEMVK